ncbi:hypothetical protein [Thermosulfurimonas sp. F29]|uniref:hypothetical protein n=1 Tax=Thermosulfurimonas sp. F29 TaxID=2867247 RepID=UPI001C83B9D9|nr:hypothetical protein [Thermosulfurimonas sp. F29]MBX6423402.1 hypothetical protein [Thermosulfurimonas sp. F29]
MFRPSEGMRKAMARLAGERGVRLSQEEDPVAGEAERLPTEVGPEVLRRAAWIVRRRAEELAVRVLGRPSSPAAVQGRQGSSAPGHEALSQFPSGPSQALKK